MGNADIYSPHDFYYDANLIMNVLPFFTEFPPQAVPELSGLRSAQIVAIGQPLLLVF